MIRIQPGVRRACAALALAVTALGASAQANEGDIAGLKAGKKGAIKATQTQFGSSERVSRSAAIMANLSVSARRLAGATFWHGDWRRMAPPKRSATISPVVGGSTLCGKSGGTAKKKLSQ